MNMLTEMGAKRVMNVLHMIKFQGAVQKPNLTGHVNMRKIQQ